MSILQTGTIHQNQCANGILAQSCPFHYLAGSPNRLRWPCNIQCVNACAWGPAHRLPRMPHEAMEGTRLPPGCVLINPLPISGAYQGEGDQEKASNRPTSAVVKYMVRRISYRREGMQRGALGQCRR